MYARPLDDPVPAPGTLDPVESLKEYQPLFDLAARDFEHIYPFARKYTDRATKDDLQALWEAGRRAVRRGGSTVAMIGLAAHGTGIDGGGESLALYAGIGQSKMLFLFEKHLEWGCQSARMFHPEHRFFILNEPCDYILEDLKLDLALVAFNFGHDASMAELFMPYLAPGAEMIFCAPGDAVLAWIEDFEPGPVERSWSGRLLTVKWR